MPGDSAGSCSKCSPDGSISSMATEIITVFKQNGTEVAMTVKSTILSCCKSRTFVVVVFHGAVFSLGMYK